MQSLKHCRICGGEVYMHRTTPQGMSAVGVSQILVKCSKCGNVVDLHEKNCVKTAEKWNRL